MIRPLKPLLLIFLLIHLSFGAAAQIIDQIPGSWKSNYSEAKDFYSLTLVTIFTFNSDGTYSQSGHYNMVFNGKDHGNCVIDITSCGTWSVSEDRVYFEPDKSSTKGEMSEIRMSKSLENLFRTTVVPKMVKRYTGRRSSVVKQIEAESMTLKADDGRVSKFTRTGNKI